MSRIGRLPIPVPAGVDVKIEGPKVTVKGPKGSLEHVVVEPITVAQEAMRRLMAFPWPGNVRQLENAIERALALIGARTQIEATDLPPDVQAITEVVTPALDLPAEGVDLSAIVMQIEKSLIERALARTGNNKGAAARLLSLKRTTLVEKLKRM